LEDVIEAHGQTIGNDAMSVVEMTSIMDEAGST
jgi:hypothetical protein